MRDLTAEELALAPEWATHYQFGVLGNLIFLSLRKMLAWNVNLPMSLTVDLDDCSHLICNPKPIQAKKFDITQHEWSDCRNLQFAGRDEGLDTLCFKVDVGDGVVAFFDLDKDDSIAIARALGVTPEDLK